MLNCSSDFRKIIGTSEEAREPYRYFLRRMRWKLEATRNWAESHLEGQPVDSSGGSVYTNKQQVLDDLLQIFNSLESTNNANITKGRLTHLIRNVASFGVTLCALDVRQESTRHTEALDAITRYLGIGSYAEWDEDTKLSWLSKEMTNKRALLRHRDWYDNPMFSETVVDTLETFAMIAECHEESLGAYVISQATSASDVMAVSLLQRNAGVKDPLRVVPLFETLDDLNGAMGTMETLYTNPSYIGTLQHRKQEIMIGYR